MTAAAVPLLFRTLLRDPVPAASGDRLAQRPLGLCHSCPGGFWGLAEAGKWEADPCPGPPAQRLGTPAAFGTSKPRPLHGSHVLLQVLPGLIPLPCAPSAAPSPARPAPRSPARLAFSSWCQAGCDMRLPWGFQKMKICLLRSIEDPQKQGLPRSPESPAPAHRRSPEPRSPSEWERAGDVRAAGGGAEQAQLRKRPQLS